MNRAVDLRDLRTHVELEDGRVTMAATTQARVGLQVPRHVPLGAGETHATLVLSGVDDDASAAVRLDRDALAALADAVDEACAEMDVDRDRDGEDERR